MGSHKVFKWHSTWIKLGKIMDVKAMVFPVMYGCDSWAIKKAECWRIETLESWCWRRLLTVPWTARRSNLSIIKELNWIFIGRADAETEAPVLCPTDVKSQLIWKDTDAGKDWRQREQSKLGDGMVSWHHGLSGHKSGQTHRQWKTGKPNVLPSTALHNQAWLSDWTVTNNGRQ